MKLIFVRAALAFVALLLPFGLVGAGNAVAVSPVMSDPDITIVFYGLMVFDAPSNGTQVVRLHSGAHDHEVSIRIKGPGYPRRGYEWGNAYPRNSVLDFKVVKADSPSPDSAVYPEPRPYHIKGLHPSTAELGDLSMEDGVFGPMFTLHAGDFSEVSGTRVDFIRRGDMKPGVFLSTVVQATIHLRDGEIGGFLTGGVPNGVRLPDVFLERPGGETKWTIEVGVDPIDHGHLCGDHFTEYYQGFKFKKRREDPGVDLESFQRYYPRITGATDRPCDYQPLTFKKMREEKTMTQMAIETRPCIPISYP